MAAIAILKTPRQSGGSISSGLVVWPGGINITNQLSDTFAILDAPGLEGAHINGQKIQPNKQQRPGCLRPDDTSS
ncbi:fimbria/pilus outer membrane usher protein [Escherichia coli]|nr:fimbria/pilus outer membrane usher protein [Escherichia coli]